MKASIIIATRNRVAQLEQTLGSLKAVSSASKTPHEVIIVDNGSTDGTYDLAAQFPAFKFMHEARPGKSIACNFAARKATGDIFIFTDDDVRFPVGWIDHMTAPVYSGAADAVQGGVKIAPHLERPWLRGMLRTWVAEVGADAPVGLVGANMAIHREAYFNVGGLDERLGPGASGFYDDTKLGLSVVPNRIAHLPSCAVEHHFDAGRLTFKAFVNISNAMARSAGIAGFRSRPVSALSFLKLAVAFARIPSNRWESFFLWDHQIKRART